MGIEGTYLNIIKAIYDKTTANTILNGCKAESFSSKSRSKTRMPTIVTFIQHNTGSPSHSNQTRKRDKNIQVEKEEVKLSLFADDMILCIVYNYIYVYIVIHYMYSISIYYIYRI